MSNDKEKKKQILRELNEKQAEEFLRSLPLTREVFQELFDHLDLELSKEECDDTHRVTKQFLTNKGITDDSSIINWLADNGGYCDCEVLANVEEKFI